VTDDDFLREQFITLRREIEESKSRIYRTMGFGIVMVPAANFVGQKYGVEVLILSLPLLVVVVPLMYLSDNHAMMRCGRYIRLHIEPHFPDVVGWERWLETPSSFQPRSVDRYVSYSFYLLFFVYFVGAAFVAVRDMKVDYGDTPATIMLELYVVVGGWFLIYLTQNIRISTATSRMAKLNRQGRGTKLRVDLYLTTPARPNFDQFCLKERPPNYSLKLSRPGFGPALKRIG
jgi:hypothetical protein